MIAGRKDHLTKREGRALGSPLRLTVLGSESDADRAWVTIERMLADVDSAMSRFREDSALTRLCRRSPDAMDDVPRMLGRALVAADRATRVTGGSFDPRIVAALERIGYVGVPQRRGPTVADGPTSAAGEPTGAPEPTAVGRRILHRDGRSGPISLPVPVDLGGIGKGLALRWAANALDRLFGDDDRAVAGYLIDAGGDIVASGAPTPAGAWSVGIEDPTGAANPVAVLNVVGRGAVATSSISRLHWQQHGRTVHHLIDPRTGAPGGDGLVSVTVAGPDPAWAEVWSKALFLEGARGIAAAARRRGIAAWWVPTDARLEMTPAARVRTTWVAAESLST